MTTSIITNNSKYFLSDWIALDYTVPGGIVLGTGNVGSVSKSNTGSVSLTSASGISVVGFYSNVINSNSVVGTIANFSVNSPSSNATVQISGIASSISTSIQPNNILIGLGSVVSGGNVGNLSYSSVVSSVSGNSSNVSNSSVICTPTVPLVNLVDYCDGSYTLPDYVTGYITSGITYVGGITSYSINLSLSSVTGTGTGNSFAFGILPISGNSAIGYASNLQYSATLSISGTTGSTSIGTELNNTTLLLSGTQVSSSVSSPDYSTTVSISGNAGSTSIGTEPNNTILAISGNSANSITGSTSSNTIAVTSGNTSTGTVNTSTSSNAHGLLGNSQTGFAGYASSTYTLSILGTTGSTSIGTEPNNTILAISGNVASSNTGNIIVFSGITSYTSLGNLSPNISHSISSNTATSSIGNLLVVTNAISALSVGSTGTVLPTISNAISTVSGNLYTNSLVVPIEQFIYGNRATVTNGNVVLSSVRTILGNTGSTAIANEPNNHILNCASISGLSNIGSTVTNTTSNISNVVGYASTGVLAASVSKSIDGIEVNSTIAESIGYSNSNRIQSNQLLTYFGDISISSSNSISGNLGNISTGIEYPVDASILSNVVSNTNIGSVYHDVTIGLSRLPSLTGKVNNFDSKYSVVGLPSNNLTTLLSDIQSNSINSIRLDRIYAQSGLIIQERSNGIIGNTGTISYGNEQTDHRELLSSVTGYSNVSNINHNTSVYTPCVEEIVSGLSGNCSSNVIVGLSGNSTSIYQSSIDGFVTDPNVILSISGNSLTTHISSDVQFRISRIISSNLSYAQSGLIVQERSNGIVGNTATISYGNEPTIVSKGLSTITIGGNVGNILSDATHNIPGVEETAHVVAGNFGPNVSISISGITVNIDADSLASSRQVQTTKVESISRTGNIPSIGMATYTIGIEVAHAVGTVLPAIDRSISLTGNQLQSSINNINAVFYSKPIVGVVSNGSVSNLKSLQGNIRLVSVGLVRFVRTGIQDIEFSETINRNIRY